jgi:RNA polymerase sigma-70 factor (ECF subfamily)
MGSGASASGFRTEAALLRSVAARKADAAEALVARFWDDAYRVAFLLLHDRGVAEEVAQDALLSAIQSIDTFDLDRPFGPWLQRIAANRAYDRLRSRRRRPELAVEDVEASTAGSDDAIADAIARQAISEELIEALAALDPEFRSAVVLRHLLDYEPREIAAIAGVPAATVRTRIHRGLLRLRDALTNEEGEHAHERVG